MARINNTEIYPLTLNSTDGMFLGTDSEGRTVNFSANLNNGVGNSAFVVIDSVYIQTDGKTDLEMREGYDDSWGRTLALAYMTSMLMTEDDVMQMSQIEGGILIPAGSIAHLQPGGLHIMMIGLVQDLEAGTMIELTLSFDDDTVIELDVPVQEMETGAMMNN